MNFELAIAVGLPATFFVAAFIVGCFEKRPVKVFAPADFSTGNNLVDQHYPVLPIGDFSIERYVTVPMVMISG